MSPATSPGFRSIIIVGAGPSGLLLALCLASLEPGPEITILDAAETLDQAPRATHYGTPAIQLFRKVGILPEIRRDGYVPNDVCWRKLDGTRIAGWDWRGSHALGLEGDHITVYPVGQMCELLERELENRAVLKVRWGCKVTAIKSGLQDGDERATVKVEEGDVTRDYSADYVVGTDGGNSTQIVATNTEYDFDQFGWEDSTFIIHPEHFFMAARIAPHPDPKKNIWRISYDELPGLSNEELMERQPMKFEKMLPGHLKPDQYRVSSKSPYRVHQRYVDSMRMHRVKLAADAAHLCNPFGGMGLTGGIADIAGLFQCLEGMHKGLTDDSILDVWSDVQTKKWHEIINPITSSNIKRLFDQDPEKAGEEDEFLVMLKKAEADAHMREQLKASGNQLNYDYSQHFTKASNSL